MEYPRDRCLQLLSNYAQDHPELADVEPGLERPPEDVQADFAVAWPMRAADVVGKPPRELATELAEWLNQDDAVRTTEVAGPGFVNLTFTDEYLLDTARKVLRTDTIPFPPLEGPNSSPPSFLLEFVSANPTGPLHVGHGRGAVYGDTLGRLLELHGCEVHREYYVNDAGTQIDRLAESLRLRLRQANGEDVELGEDHYKGAYLLEFAKAHPELLDASDDELAEEAKEFILEQIFDDLEDCGITFDRVTSEQDVATDQAREDILTRLDDDDLLERRDGAVFLKTSEAGDDKDRVLIRSNGEPTYFANDLVYHHEKFNRDHDQYVDVWGHDHHGYQERLRAGLEFLGDDVDHLEIELYQLVDLYRDGEPLNMSTREGKFVPLRELLEEVGRDALRVNFLTTNHDRPLDFDVELARSEDDENPVYYVQYAHTRMASIMEESDWQPDPEALNQTEELTPEGRRLLLDTLDFPHFTRKSARDRNPHQVTFALKDMASRFHSYYGQHQVLSDEEPDRSRFRLSLVEFLRQMFHDGLTRALAVEAPRSM